MYTKRVGDKREEERERERERERDIKSTVYINTISWLSLTVIPAAI